MDELSRKIKVSLYLIGVVFLIGTLGFYVLLDGMSLVDAFYLTVITLSTVGYGDFNPVDNRRMDIPHWCTEIFTVALILFGMTIFLYTVGIVTEYIVSGEMRRSRHRKRMRKLIGQMSGHYIICGCGETGAYMIAELRKTKREFVVIEKSRDRLRELQEQFPGLCFIMGDATVDKNFDDAGLERAAGIALCLPDEKDNLFCVLSLVQKRAEISGTFRIAAKATNWEKTAPKLKAAGADIVIAPHFISGRRMVSEMFRPSVTTFLDSMLQDTRAVMRVDQVTIGEKSFYANNTLGFSGIRERTGLTIIALRKKGEKEFIHNPKPSQMLAEGDVLITLGNIEDIEDLRALANKI